MRTSKHAIFCLEGDWWNDMNRGSTVRPILELVNQAPDQNIQYIHRDVGTVEEFEFYCRKWSQRGMSRYDILYLAFHGSRDRGLHVGDQRRKNNGTTLEALAPILGSNLKSRIVHFGSCGTLRVDRRRLQKFLRETGLVAMTGYKEDVDWLFSASFEVLLFDVLTRYPFTIRGMKQARDELFHNHGAMCRRLDFRMEIRDRRVVSGS